jgi:RNA polymerase sigma-70 factor, ECF subfamily
VPEFTALLEEQIPRLRRYARALTRNVTSADDLVQDCLARAIGKQHLWEKGTNLRAWLFTILHNQHVNDVRRQVREGQHIPISTVVSDWHQASKADAASYSMPELHVEARAGDTLRLRDLMRALALLPVEQQQTILLIGYEEMSLARSVPDFLGDGWLYVLLWSVMVATVRASLPMGMNRFRLA